jgi:short-subunit dehydrogenase
LFEEGKEEENRNKYIIIYGACSHIGELAASLFLKYGYSLILIDTKL